MDNLESLVYILDCGALTVLSAVREYHVRICVISFESVLMLRR
jgi:hypothetical protein